MEHPINILHILPDPVRIILAVLTSLFIIFLTTPSVRKIARGKKIFDKPDPRKVHTGKIPLIGGIVIFLAFFLSVIIFTGFTILHDLPFLLAGGIFIFLIGLKDDILVTAPLTKLISFILISTILIILGNIRITDYHGLFTLTRINYTFSVITSLAVILVIINGFNFIDGIDGLAGSIGILCSLVFGTWFLLTGQNELCLVSFILGGSLAGFLVYNLSPGKKKMFMGDSGSLLVGLVMAYLGIRFNESIPRSGIYTLHSAPAVAFGIMVVPLMDFLRAFITRLFRGRSLFSPDREHFHHQLIKLGLSHIQATIYLVATNCIIIFLSFLLDGIGILWLMLLNVSVYLFLTSVPGYIVRFRRK